MASAMTAEELTLAAMEADLGDDIAKRLFESSGDRERGAFHRVGAGAKLFDLSPVDSLVGEWHKFRETDDMRDLKAEAAGDINMGQTHRLNRIAEGITPIVHKKVHGSAFPSRLHTALADRTNAVGGMAGKSSLEIAKEMAASFKSSGGSKAHYEKLKKGGVAGSYTQPLPAKLPGPKIPIPRGARKAMDLVSQASTSSSYAPSEGNAAYWKHRNKTVKKARAPRPSPQPPLLASPVEFLSTLPVGPGLGKSKHAPPPQDRPDTAVGVVAAGPGLRKSKHAASQQASPETTLDVVATPPQPRAAVTSVRENNTVEPGLRKSKHAPPLQAKPGNIVESAAVAEESRSAVTTIRADQAVESYDTVVTPVLVPTLAKTSAMRSTETPSLVESDDATPSPPYGTLPKTPAVTALATVSELSTGKPLTDDFAFADVSEDWVCGVGSEEESVTDASTKKLPSEGILPDGRVRGGPYFLAAIIAHMPRVANPDLGA